MKKFIEEFKTFALRGNVMDMAVGVIIGGAFSGIVTSLTDNFINPILNLLTGLTKKEEAPAEPETKICPYCQSEISIKATRCPHCTSILEETKAE